MVTLSSRSKSSGLLILPGARKGLGVLKLRLDDDSTIGVRLKGRHVKVLMIYDQALNAREMDAAIDCDEDMVGWLTDAEVAEAYASDPLEIPPGPEAIATYRTQIKAAIRRATPPRQTPPQLFATERGVGVRLVRRITVMGSPRPNSCWRQPVGLHR